LITSVRRCIFCDVISIFAAEFLRRACRALPLNPEKIVVCIAPILEQAKIEKNASEIIGK
jgi:hypothetical protein